MGIIYVLQNKANGKCYVGQTIKPFNRRFRQHCQSGSYIGRALRKYKVKGFDKIIFENILEDQLDLLEQEYILKYNSIAPNGYNLTHGGKNGKFSEESKNRKPKESRVGEKNPFYGKHHTEKSKKSISEAKKGQIPWMKNKTHTEEARKLMSELKKGKPSSFKGKAHTEESKEKNRVAHLGVSPSNKGIRSPHPCPICGKQRKERYSKEGFKGYLKTCGSSVCITGLRNKSNSLKFLGSAKTSL
tara:strand:+ start:1336 stop:2067 length:732 start_codon:yes stop_codon:yes gene_type:complete